MDSKFQTVGLVRSGMLQSSGRGLSFSYERDRWSAERYRSVWQKNKLIMLSMFKASFIVSLTIRKIYFFYLQIFIVL
jgi:hypothetical protein